MASIGVYNDHFLHRGGVGAVCVHLLDSLSDVHEVTLVSVDSPDFDALSEYYGVELDGVNSVTVREDLYRDISGRDGDAEGVNLFRLLGAIYNRLLKNVASEFDLFISAAGLLCLPESCIQYFHAPVLNRHRFDDVEEDCDEFYDKVLNRISGFDVDELRNSTVLTNSEWSADRFESGYGFRPKVVYPPVVPASEYTNSIPWEEREEGFVMIGRITADKRQLMVVNIINELASRGREIHLHLVGPFQGRGGELTPYAKEVRDEAENNDAVHLEGSVSRDRLMELIATHRYGIHGKEDEHFGIAVAEMVAGGMITFVPNGGGQREIVDEIPEVTYESPAGAREKIEHVLSNERVQRRLRRRLSETRGQFGKKQFTEDVRRIVDENLTT